MNPDIHIKEIRSLTDLPLAVGFGVRERRDVEAIWKLAEGAVVGSALVERVERAGKDKAFETARDFVRELTSEA